MVVLVNLSIVVFADLRAQTKPKPNLRRLAGLCFPTAPRHVGIDAAPGEPILHWGKHMLSFNWKIFCGGNVLVGMSWVVSIHSAIHITQPIRSIARLIIIFKKSTNGISIQIWGSAFLRRYNIYL